MRVIYLFICCETHTQSTLIKKKRLAIHWPTLNAHSACQKAALYFSTVIAAKLGVLGNGHSNGCINMFPLLSLDILKARTTLIELLV